jgi:hypothetical protein
VAHLRWRARARYRRGEVGFLCLYIPCYPFSYSSNHIDESFSLICLVSQRTACPSWPLSTADILKCDCISFFLCAFFTPLFLFFTLTITLAAMLALVRTSLPRSIPRYASRSLASRVSIAGSYRVAPATRTLATLASTQNAPSLGSSAVSESLFAPLDAFAPRHLGPRPSDIQEMLQALGYDSIESFVDDTIPSSIRLPSLEGAQERLPRLSESELLYRGNQIGNMNVVKKSLIGMGYYNTKVPPVIQRTVSVFIHLSSRAKLTHLIFVDS